MPRTAIDTLKTARPDDRPWPVAPVHLLDALFGAALLAQGQPAEQAAERVRRLQACRALSAIPALETQP